MKKRLLDIKTWLLIVTLPFFGKKAFHQFFRGEPKSSRNVVFGRIGIGNLLGITVDGKTGKFIFSASGGKRGDYGEVWLHSKFNDVYWRTEGFVFKNSLKNENLKKTRLSAILTTGGLFFSGGLGDKVKFGLSSFDGWLSILKWGKEGFIKKNNEIYGFGVLAKREELVGETVFRLGILPTKGNLNLFGAALCVDWKKGFVIGVGGRNKIYESWVGTSSTGSELNVTKFSSQEFGNNVNGVTINGLKSENKVVIGVLDGKEGIAIKGKSGKRVFKIGSMYSF